MTLLEALQKFGVPPLAGAIVFVATSIIVALVTKWLMIPISPDLIAGIAFLVAVPTVAIWFFVRSRQRSPQRKGAEK
jgi:hypothetical protein